MSNAPQDDARDMEAGAVRLRVVDEAQAAMWRSQTQPNPGNRHFGTGEEDELVY
jgi:hypothetical protein